MSGSTNTELYSKLLLTTSEAVARAKEKIDTGVFVERYIGWRSTSPLQHEGSVSLPLPIMDITDYFFPRFPNNYKSLFESSSGPKINIKDLSGYSDLLAFAKSDPQFQAYFGLKDQDGNIVEGFITHAIEDTLLNIVDRFIQLNGTEFNEEGFRKIYKEIENAIYIENLPIHIVIPIAFVYFEEDEFQLSDNRSIRKLPDKFNKSRALISNYGSSVHEKVVDAASHGFYLSDFTMPNHGYFVIRDVPSQASAFPLSEIDLLFSAIRIVTGIETGFAQLLIEPIEWAKYYLGDLPPLQGTTIRKYPPHFDNFYWKNKSPKVNKEQLQKIANLYLQMQSINNNQFKVALHRLNQCYLRENEEDTVIDALIGLEALLSSDSKSEIIYRLSIRAAAILALDKTWTEKPSQIRKNIKNLYDFRSKVVHGVTAKKKKSKKLEEVFLPEIPMNKQAINYLRAIIKIMVENPVYFSTAAIDEALITDKFLNPP